MNTRPICYEMPSLSSTHPYSDDPFRDLHARRDVHKDLLALKRTLE